MYDSSQMTKLTLFVSHCSVKTYQENRLLSKHQETIVCVQSQCDYLTSITDSR